MKQKKKPTSTKKKQPNKKQKFYSSQTITGIIDISKNSLGYVSVPGLDNDIVIPREYIKNALHGDTVEITLIANNKKRQEASITKIIQRALTQTIGTLQLSEKFAFVIPQNEQIKTDIYIPIHKCNGAKNKDKVLVKITEWNEKSKNPNGEIVEIITPQNEQKIYLQSIVNQKGFELSFPQQVINELELTLEKQNSTEPRLDLRTIFTITIDPHNAKDFDDAISYQLLPNGLHQIGVHIADVSHFVTPNTALDQEAYKRATSVYMPTFVVPMLPEKISNELCSLRPNEDKKTFSVLFELDDNAVVKSFQIHKTLIHSIRRYTYEEVQEIIEGKQDIHQKTIIHLHTLAQKIRQERIQNGAINFGAEEIQFLYDTNQKPIGTAIIKNNESHQLIEEYMLLANKTVAHFIHSSAMSDAPIPFPYRIHSTPDERKLNTFISFLSKNYKYGFNTATPKTIAQSFNAFIQKSAAHPEQFFLQKLGIRTMAKAEYATQNIGHYGLHFEDYCHFTSPIRRYPDIMAHRIVWQVLQKQYSSSADNTKAIVAAQCMHSSEQERKAMEAERDGNKYIQIVYMQQFVGNEFEGVICGVAAFGFWVEIIPHKCEGFVAINTLNEPFKYIENEYLLLGTNTKTKYQMGKKVRIKVAAANTEKMQLDYELVV